MVVGVRAGVFHCTLRVVSSRGHKGKRGRKTNLVDAHPFHGLWSEKPLESLVRQLFLGHDFHDIFIVPIGLNGAVIFERQELGFFSIFPDGGEDRPWCPCSWLQSKIRRVRMRSVGGEHRREDGLIWSFRNLDCQRFWQGNLRCMDRGGQDRVPVVDGPVRAPDCPCVGVRVPFDALDLYV